MLVDGDIDGDSIGVAISLLEADGALDAAGWAAAPPPQAARVSGKVMAAARAAIRTKRELVKLEVMDMLGSS
jgi:hypothetical protein